MAALVNKPHVVLGVHYGHDANAALVVDGQLVAAVQEERLTRKKFHSGYPFLAIQDVLRIAQKSVKDVNQVVIVGAKRKAETGGGNFRVIRERFGSPSSSFLNAVSPLLTTIDNLIFGSIFRSRFVVRELERALRRTGILADAAVEFYDHHFAHALGGFYLSHFLSATVITLDGKGDALSGSIREFVTELDGKVEYKTISENSEIDSLGFPYSCVTEYLGFRRLRHEGKVTGLAAFGNPERFDKVPFPVEYTKESFTFKSMLPAFQRTRSSLGAWLHMLRRYPKQFRKIVSSGAGAPGRLVQLEIDDYLRRNLPNDNPADVASWVQTNTEVCVQRLIQDLVADGPRKIVVSGGLFGNVRLNQLIRETRGVEDLFVLQGMGDGGLAVGPSLHAANQRLKLPPDSRKVTNVFLGARYSSEEILEAVRKSGIPYRRPSLIENEIAGLIHQGLIVGHFEGRMEWGPRALGNRSILASPTDAQINQILNDRLRRTEFMPFAPMILEEIACAVLEKYDSSHRAAEFMTTTYAVKHSWRPRIPAVVHIDGTARPQIVKKEFTPRLHSIISEYQQLSGLGVVINTSFNLHEEPIVESPEDAIRSLEQNAIDVLAIGDFLVSLDDSKIMQSRM